MDYQPSLPEHNDNISHSRPLKEFLEIAASLAVIGLIVFWCVGLLVDWVVDDISAQTVASINRMMTLPRPETPEALMAREAQVRQLVTQLRQCANLPAAPDVMLVDQKVVNAAVLPGGRMIVFAGLLKQIKSENGLSFVLAHELAHLEHRDHLRGMGRGLVLAAVSVLLTGGDADLAQILSPAATAGNAKYSRAREAAADTRALQILHCRYGHVGGATELFELLKDEDETAGFSHFLASHPSMEDRIAELRKAIAERKMPVRPVQPFSQKAAAGKGQQG